MTGMNIAAHVCTVHMKNVYVGASGRNVTAGGRVPASRILVRLLSSLGAQKKQAAHVPLRAYELCSLPYHQRQQLLPVPPPETPLLYNSVRACPSRNAPQSINRSVVYLH